MTYIRSENCTSSCILTVETFCSISTICLPCPLLIANMYIEFIFRTSVYVYRNLRRDLCRNYHNLPRLFLNFSSFDKFCSILYHSLHFSCPFPVLSRITGTFISHPLAPCEPYGRYSQLQTVMDVGSGCPRSWRHSRPLQSVVYVD